MSAQFQYRKSQCKIERTDRKSELNHFIKKQMIDKSKKQIDKEDKYQTATSPEVAATDEVTTASKNASYHVYHKSKRFLQKRLKRYQLNKTSQDEVLLNENYTTQSKIKIFNQNKAQISHSETSNNQMKQYVINKTKEPSQTIYRPVTTKTKEFIKNTSEVITKKVFSSNNQLILGGAICLLLVFALIFSSISSLASDSSIVPAQQMLSEEVLAYEETIIKYAKENGIEDYVKIIEAIMMQESKGLGNDPMQASECPYNTKYPNAPNGITDPEYSIKVGIKYYANCLSRAKVKDVNDDNGIALSLQGYNFGNGYIEWALTNFNGYTKANAKVFSDMKKEQLKTDTYGDPDYVDHVLRYVSFGFGNLRSEPNFNNTEAWVTKNPYAQAGLYGQCTWFAWGRFYEIYGYSPGFTGDGSECVDQLVAAHPDKFKKSNTPVAGAIFSTLGHNHVGIVIAFDGTNITIQDGNYDGITNTFSEAKKDWRTQTMTLKNFISINGGVVFANPK